MFYALLCIFMFCNSISYSTQEQYRDESSNSKGSPQTARLFDLLMNHNYSQVSYQRSHPKLDFDQTAKLLIPKQTGDTHIQKIPRKNSKSLDYDQQHRQQIEDVDLTVVTPIPGHYITYIPPFQRPEEFNSQQVENIPDQLSQDHEDQSYQINIPDQTSQQFDPNYQQNIPDQNVEDNPYQQNIPESYPQSAPDQNVQRHEDNPYQQNIPDSYQQSVPDQNVQRHEDNPNQNVEQIENDDFQQNVQDQNIEDFEEHFYQQHHYQGSIPHQPGILGSNPHDQTAKAPVNILPTQHIPLNLVYGTNPQRLSNSRPVYRQSATAENKQYFGKSSDQIEYSQNNYGSHQIAGKNSEMYGFLECPKGATGRFPYALDCKQFLNCWKGRGSIQNCAPGTVFNPETVECDFPQKVKCGAYKSQANYFDTEKYPESYLGKNRDSRSQNDQIAEATNYQVRSQSLNNRVQTNVNEFCPNGVIGLRPHPSDCSKYINCSSDGAFIEECILGMKFNFKTGNCDFPRFVDCKSQNKPQLIDNDNEQNTDPSNESSNKNRQCPNGFSGLMAHPSNCELFLNCANGRTFVQNCGPGTVFNPTILACDYPYNVDCKHTSEQIVDPNVNPNPYPHPTPNPNPNLIPQPTPNPNPNPLPQPTPDPNLNPNIDIRMLPKTHNQHYFQDNRSGRYANQHENSDQYSQSISNGNTQAWTRSSRVTEMQANPRCPKDVTGLIPHPSKCDSFFNCNNGQTFLQKCGTGTVFNPNILACDFPYNVNCQHSETTTEQNVDPAIDIRIAPSNQNQYIRSGTQVENQWSGVDNQQLHEQATFGEQEQVNWRSFEHSRSHLGPFEFASSHDTQNNPKCPQGVTGFISHPSHCDSYLNCNNGQTLVQKCGPGALFNPITLACDFPQNVNCQQSETIAEPNVDIRNATSNQNQYIRSGTQAANQWSGIDNQQLLEQATFGQQDQINWRSVEHSRSHLGPFEFASSHGTQNNPKCPQGATGLIPHPSQCDSYLNCNNGQNLLQKCAPGTLFNPKIKACDYPNNVNCVQRPITEPYVDTDNINAGQVVQNNWKPISPGHDNHQRHEHHGSWNHGGFQHSEQFHRQHHRQHGHPRTPIETTTISAKEREELDLWYQFVSPPPNNKDLEGAASSNTYGVKGVEKKPTGFQKKTLPKPPKKSSCFPHKFECSPDMCLSLAFVCDGFKHCPNGADEENCKNVMENVKSYKGKRLVRHDVQKWFSITLDKCAQYCETSKTFVCKSFNYRSSNGECVLSDQVVGQTGDMEASHHYDFYEMKKHTMNCDMKYTCDNFKCIELHEACNGVDNCGDGSDEKYCTKYDNEFGIRLVGSKNMNEGRLEVKVFGRWGTVCDDKFSLLNAEVACRELGYPLGAVQVLHETLYFAETNQVQNPNNTLILMDDVQCVGNETSLRHCQFNGWGVHNCEVDETVGVICKTSTVSCPKDYWLCAASMECIPLAFLCDHVEDCVDKSDESPTHCEAKTELRLANGTTPLEGRVEIRFFGVWGTICDDDFTDEAATVVCNQMGYYGPAQAKKGGLFGSGSGPIWLDQVSCFGNESSVEKCLHNERGQHNCEHNEDVGVVCSRGYDSRATDSVYNIPKTAARFGTIHSNALELDDVMPASCGIRDEETFIPDSGVAFRVVAGSVAKKGHYPWQASLRVKGQTKTSHWCGGVIISKYHVLTAAHCLVGFSKSIYVIRAGDYESEIDEGTEQEAYIEEIYMHESFRKGHHMNNDLALIKLKGNGFTLEKHVQAICLPDEDTDYAPGKNCTISGWGSTQSGRLSAALQLRAGWIPIQSAEVCRQPEVYGNSIQDGMFCAGSLDEGVDSCDGDSGGPLACLNNGFFTLYGITSWGQHCGYANKPGVYVKIGHYKQWIDETIKKSLK